MERRNITRPAWAEIDLNCITHNMQELRRTINPKTGIMAVVKANAYGHGAAAVSKRVLENGANYLAVAILNEARELREAGIKAPILILGYTPDEQALDVVEMGITQTVYSVEGAEALSRAAVQAGRIARLHVKVDTGLGRLGVMPDKSGVEEILKIFGLPSVEIEGLYTHFSIAGAGNKDYTRLQYERFLHFDALLKEAGVQIPIKHVANSAAAIDLPDMHLDMVRVGISIYGLYPSDEVFKDKVSLKPALSFKAQVAQIKTVPVDASISYGRKYITSKETDVATIPVGYADGYTRLLTGKAYVVIHGQRVPVIGTICMDQFMIETSGIPDIKVGDEVILIGRQGEQQVTADELAGLLGTINYEIVCMLGARVPRIYLD